MGDSDCAREHIFNALLQSRFLTSIQSQTLTWHDSSCPEGMRPPRPLLIYLTLPDEDRVWCCWLAEITLAANSFLSCTAG